MKQAILNDSRGEGRRAIRVDSGGTLNIVITGQHGDVWTVEETLEAERAAEIISKVEAFWDELPDDEGSIAIGIGTPDAPRFRRMSLEQASEEAAAWIGMMHAEVDRVIDAQGAQWGAEESDNAQVLGPSGTAFLGWAAAFLFVLGSGLTVSLLGFFAALRQLAAIGGIPRHLGFMVVLPPLVVAVIYFALGRRFGKRYPDHRNPLLVAGVPLLLTAPTLFVAPADFLFLAALFIPLPLIAFVGARTAR